jgi:hypothetical protein
MLGHARPAHALGSVGCLQARDAKTQGGRRQQAFIGDAAASSSETIALHPRINSLSVNFQLKPISDAPIASIPFDFLRRNSTTMHWSPPAAFRKTNTAQNSQQRKLREYFSHRPDRIHLRIHAINDISWVEKSRNCCKIQ